MAGYSGTPLVTKLGIKAGHRVLVVSAPRGFRDTLGTLPDGVRLSTRSGAGPWDVIVVFVKTCELLTKQMKVLRAVLQPNGGLWAAWPKKSSGVKTDVTEDSVRAVAFPLGLVDNKVCAIDETWSGLRCVIRLENR